MQINSYLETNTENLYYISVKTGYFMTLFSYMKAQDIINTIDSYLKTRS